MQREAVVSAGVELLALLLYVVGFASPYWISWTTFGVSENMGLWQMCALNNGTRWCWKIQEVVKISGYHRAAQVLGCFSLVCAVGGAVFCVLWALRGQAVKRGTLLVAGILTLAAGVLALVTVVCFAHDWKHHLSWAFGLCAAAVPLHLVVGAIAVVFLRKSTSDGYQSI